MKSEMPGLHLQRKHYGPSRRTRDPEAKEGLLPECGIYQIIGTSDFPRLFSGAAEFLRNCYWLLSDVEFILPDDWFGEADIENIPPTPKMQAFTDRIISSSFGTASGNVYAKPGFISCYSEYISDDWCELIALDAPLADPRDISAWVENDRAGMIIENAHAYFRNVDAAFWEIFSFDETLLRLVESRTAELPESSIRRVVLSQDDVF